MMSQKAFEPRKVLFIMTPKNLIETLNFITFPTNVLSRSMNVSVKYFLSFFSDAICIKLLLTN